MPTERPPFTRRGRSLKTLLLLAGAALALTQTSCKSQTKWNPSAKHLLPASITHVRQLVVSGARSAYFIAQDGGLWRTDEGKTEALAVAFGDAPANLSFIASDGQGGLLVIANDKELVGHAGRLTPGATEIKAIGLKSEPRALASAGKAIYYVDTTTALRRAQGDEDTVLFAKDINAVFASPEGSFLAIAKLGGDKVLVSKSSPLSWLSVEDSEGSNLVGVTDAGRVGLLRVSEQNKESPTQEPDLDLCSTDGKTQGVTGGMLVTAYVREDASAVVQLDGDRLAIEFYSR